MVCLFHTIHKALNLTYYRVSVYGKQDSFKFYSDCVRVPLARHLVTTVGFEISAYSDIHCKTDCL